MKKNRALIIFGPTASGKSSLALEIASKQKATIINADSLQIYSDLRILTSRPSIEDETKFNHKLYGVLDGNENCTLDLWLNFVKKEIYDSIDSNKLPIIVGGTGMYLKGLIEGISNIPSIPLSIYKETKKIIEKKSIVYLYEVLRKKNKFLKINVGDKQRIQRAYNVLIHTNKTIEEWNLENTKFVDDIEFDIFIKNNERSILYNKSEDRFDSMIVQGAIEEVESMMKKKYDLNSSIMKAIGVRELSDYLNGNITLDECKIATKQRTRNYIKRQLTWITGNNITQNIEIKKYM